MIQKTIMAYIENIEDNLNFNEHREFGELISTPFSFFFKNFKPIVFPMLKYAGPILVIGMIFMSFAVTDLVKNMEDVVFEGISLYYFNYTLISGVLLGFGYVMAVAIIYSYAVLYEEKGGDNFSENDIKELAQELFFQRVQTQTLPAYQDIYPEVYYYDEFLEDWWEEERRFRDGFQSAKRDF